MFYIFLHKVLQVDKHLIYFFFTCKYTECLQFVKLLYYFSICTSDASSDDEIIEAVGEENGEGTDQNEGKNFIIYLY